MSLTSSHCHLPDSLNYHQLHRMPSGRQRGILDLPISLSSAFVWNNFNNHSVGTMCAFARAGPSYFCALGKTSFCELRCILLLMVIAVVFKSNTRFGKLTVVTDRTCKHHQSMLVLYEKSLPHWDSNRGLLFNKQACWYLGQKRSFLISSTTLSCKTPVHCDNNLDLG